LLIVIAVICKSCAKNVAQFWKEF